MECVLKSNQIFDIYDILICLLIPNSSRYQINDVIMKFVSPCPTFSYNITNHNMINQRILNQHGIGINVK